MEGGACGNGVEVLTEESGEATDRLRSILLGLADPLGQQEASPVAEMRAHDPAGDLARTGYVCADGFCVAGAEGGQVLADNLPAAAIAPFADFQKHAAAADVAETFGEPGVQIRLERPGNPEVAFSAIVRV